MSAPGDHPPCGEATIPGRVPQAVQELPSEYQQHPERGGQHNELLVDVPLRKAEEAEPLVEPCHLADGERHQQSGTEQPHPGASAGAEAAPITMEGRQGEHGGGKELHADEPRGGGELVAEVEIRLAALAPHVVGPQQMSEPQQQVDREEPDHEAREKSGGRRAGTGVLQIRLVNGGAVHGSGSRRDGQA